MFDCDVILQQLNDYLDDTAPGADLDALRQQARYDRHCLQAFEAMLQVHALFSAAPMATTARDFSVSVARELLWRQRRDKAVLAGILAVAILTLMTPLLIIGWTGAVALLQPDLLQGALSWTIDAINQLALYGAATLTLIQHLPDWFIVSISTFVSLSFLLLALVLVMQKAPEQLFTPAEISQHSS